MTAGTKLAIGGAVVVAASAYMAYVGAATSWTYCITVEECAAATRKYVGKRVRVSGKVAADTLQVGTDPRRARFTLASGGERLEVVSTGRLPDNFREGGHVVVEGELEASGVFQGDRVLTRCASKYEAEDNSTSAEGTAQTNRGSDP